MQTLCSHANTSGRFPQRLPPSGQSRLSCSSLVEPHSELHAIVAIPTCSPGRADQSGGAPAAPYAPARRIAATADPATIKKIRAVSAGSDAGEGRSRGAIGFS